MLWLTGDFWLLWHFIICLICRVPNSAVRNAKDLDTPQIALSLKQDRYANGYLWGRIATGRVPTKCMLAENLTTSLMLKSFSWLLLSSALRSPTPTLLTFLLPQSPSLSVHCHASRDLYIVLVPPQTLRQSFSLLILQISSVLPWPGQIPTPISIIAFILMYNYTLIDVINLMKVCLPPLDCQPHNSGHPGICSGMNLPMLGIS